MPTLDGSVESIVYRNEENHYTVVRFRPNDRGRLFRDDLMTIVGKLPGIHVGELLSVEGEWQTDPKYGRQLLVNKYVQRLPASTEGMIRYLSSGLIKGIGPKKARLIVDHFGQQSLAIIEQQPERLSEVKGISAKDRDRIAASWSEQSEIKELHLFLQSHDVSMNIATRIYKEYGKEAIKVVRENPYQLEDVQGIGFKTADEIAVKLGLPRDSLPRLASGLKHVLTQAANDDGHCFLLENELLRRASQILEINEDALRPAMESLRYERDVFIEQPEVDLFSSVDEQKLDDDSAPPEQPQARIYFGPFWHSENGSQRLLKRLMKTPGNLPLVVQKQWEAVFAHLVEKRGMHLTEKQQDAVMMAYQQKVSILTGGPGTGK
ncbi:MAG TPA: helix-hairpin-helix domain-containing protein, partial [Ktedonobacteraceae bacterium]|nr:helix-hairpin-helix domain-containing protein [Ktedonobacteraceae bacterium]